MTAIRCNYRVKASWPVVNGSINHPLIQIFECFGDRLLQRLDRIVCFYIHLSFEDTSNGVVEWIQVWRFISKAIF
uniref:Uncharacterized protein n=1 Tax=Acrobeloides nanus TaxID=290746 RepID=A0A914DC06_9BILA